MQILFRLHFFCNVGFLLFPIILDGSSFLSVRQIFYHSLSLPLTYLVFDFVSTFIQIYFDSSLRFFALINSCLHSFKLLPFHFDILCVFQFFIPDNFYVQQKEPFFDSNQNSNITVLENESVVLKCVVRNKGNKTVSQNYFWYLKPLSTLFAPRRKKVRGDFHFISFSACVDNKSWSEQ